MTAPTAVRLTQQLEEVAAVDLTGDAEAPVAALVVDGEVVDGVDIFLPMKGQVSIPDATAEIVAALDRLTQAINASALNSGGTVPGEWTPGSEDLIQSRLENGSVRLWIPDGITPIQVEDCPEFGGATAAHDTLPVGFRPGFGIVAERVFRDVAVATPHPIGIVISTAGGVWFVTADVAVTDPVNPIPCADITFPLVTP